MMRRVTTDNAGGGGLAHVGCGRGVTIRGRREKGPRLLLGIWLLLGVLALSLFAEVFLNQLVGLQGNLGY